MNSRLAPQLKALGFVRNPFPQTPDADCYFRTDKTKQQFAEARHCLLTHKGFVLLTGEVGTGKSTFLRYLIDDLQSADCKTAYIFNTFLQGRDLLLAINRDFGLEPGKDIEDDLDRLNRFLIDAHGRGQTCIVLIDDAQNFDIATLELVRLLSNLETRQHKLLQIVLSGQPELVEMLSQPSIRQLASRIVQQVNLAPLSPDDCAQYVNFRVTTCLHSGGPITFNPGAHNSLYRLSGGNARRIHLILDRCLYGLIMQENREITASLVETAAAEAGMQASPSMVLRRRAPKSARHSRVTKAVVAALVVSSASLAFAFIGKRQDLAIDARSPVTHPQAVATAQLELQECLQQLGAIVWQPVLAAGALDKNYDVVSGALAVHGFALAAPSSRISNLPAPHCAWSDHTSAWIIWRPSRAPFTLNAKTSHDAIGWLQQRLAAAGLYEHEIDGMFGPHTHEALARYRQNHSLPSSLRIDGETLLLLEQIAVPGEYLTAHGKTRMKND